MMPTLLSVAGVSAPLCHVMQPVTAYIGTERDSVLIARFMGPTGPRRAPCWPHELCYMCGFSMIMQLRRRSIHEVNYHWNTQAARAFSITAYTWRCICNDLFHWLNPCYVNSVFATGTMRFSVTWFYWLICRNHSVCCRREFPWHFWLVAAATNHIRRDWCGGLQYTLLHSHRLLVVGWQWDW